METNNLRRILIVDDEINIVNAVKRELSTPPLGHYRYDIEGFSDPLLALEQAKVSYFDLVISDYRMPGMDGLTFLKAFAEIQPDCIALVLSGWTDMEALTKMVNQTHIFRFLPKPWHDYFLKSSVSQSLDYNGERLKNRRLADLVRQHDIPIAALAENIDQILIVGSNTTELDRLAQELSNYNKMDDLFAVIRSEMGHEPTIPLPEGKLNIQVTTSPIEALKMAEKTTFSCIFSAYKLPQMDGVKLLQAFFEKQPDCARFLIGDEINMDELISAIDLAHISGVFNQPMQDLLNLKVGFMQALTHRKMMIENRILADMLRAALPWQTIEQ